MTIQPQTLHDIREIAPQARLVHYSLDDRGRRHNQSKKYLRGIPLYDLHVTNKSYNIAELQAFGAKSVLFVNNAFDATLHRPVTVTAADRTNLGGPVGFIGAFEEAARKRFGFLSRMAFLGECGAKAWERVGRNGVPLIDTST